LPDVLLLGLKSIGAAMRRVKRLCSSDARPMPFKSEGVDATFAEKVTSA
jgi:hypothetical protein